jgi:hypothetical protein
MRATSQFKGEGREKGGKRVGEGAEEGKVCDIPIVKRVYHASEHHATWKLGTL